ncbi:MAG: glycosyltransferase family 2 protein [Bacteroidota bacterium]
MLIPISAVIITKNEVDRITPCIKSLLPFINDIVVIDNGSTDGTVKKAKELGARVFQHEWLGYGPTKNLGHTKAKNDWILSLDADESLSAELIQELKTLQLQEKMVYAMDRQNYYLGKKIKHSGWSPDWVFRIFNKRNVAWNKNLVHEKLNIPDGFKIYKLRNKLIHHSYRSTEDHKKKVEKYAKLRAQIWVDKNRHPHIFKKLFGPFFKGFKSYILQLGFLDGVAGWNIAKMNVHLVKRQLYYFDLLKKNTS